MKLNLQQRVGCSLTILRQKTGLSQSTLADRLSISRSAYSQYERGDHLPDTGTLYRLCRFYHIRADTILSCDISSMLEGHFLYHEYTREESRLLTLYCSLSEFSKGRLLERAQELAKLEAQERLETFRLDWL